MHIIERILETKGRKVHVVPRDVRVVDAVDDGDGEDGVEPFGGEVGFGGGGEVGEDCAGPRVGAEGAA